MQNIISALPSYCLKIVNKDLLRLQQPLEQQNMGAEVSRDNTATKPAQRAHDSSIPDNQLSIEAVREEERKRIARDLHDDLGQLLSTMRLRLYGCKAASKDDNAPLEAQLSAISALLDQAQHATKNIVRDLRPPVMQAAEFTSTVQDRITTFTEQSGLDCQLRTHQFNHLVLAEAQVSGLLSIIQESMLMEHKLRLK